MIQRHKELESKLGEKAVIISGGSSFRVKPV